MRLYMLCMLVASCYAFVAYDCMHANSNVSVVSLIDVDECQVKNDDQIKTKTIAIQVIQEKDWINIHIYHCKINVVKLISYCGMHSHTSMVDAGIQSYLHDVDHTECLTIHNSKSLVIERGLISGLKHNSTSSHSLTLAGTVNPSGECKGVTYVDSKSRYQNVIVTASIEISLKDYYSMVEIKSKSVVFNDGTNCDLSSLHCIHPVYGSTTWKESDVDDCNKHSRDVIYEGVARVTSDTGDMKPNALINVHQGTSLFSLQLKSPVFSCYQKGFTTDHNRVIVLERPAYGFYFEKKVIDPRNIDLTMYMNSKLSYVFGHIDVVIKELYKDLTQRDCELERMTLYNKLNVARYHPHTLGNLIDNEPGYMSVVAGEVMYVTKCQMVSVQVRKVHSCFNNLPILYNNKSLFMEPFSRIIMNTSMEIPCSPVTPPMYRVEQNWYTMNPFMSKAFNPNVIKPKMSPSSWKYENLHDLMVSGIYSADSMDKYREFMNFPLVRLEANSFITAKLTHSSAYIDSDMNGIDLIGMDTIRNTGKELIKDLLGWASSIGIFGGFMWIIIMCYKIITKLCSTAVNGITLYNVFGCGFFLLASVMTSCTHYLLAFKQRKNGRDEENQEQHTLHDCNDMSHQENDIQMTGVSSTKQITTASSMVRHSLYPSVHLDSPPL